MASVAGLLTPFSGTPAEDVHEWLKLFEVNRVLRNIGEDTARLLLSCLLRGEAREWYVYAKGEKMSLTQVVEGLGMRFNPTRSMLRAKEQLDNLSKEPTESWRGFVERFSNLANRIGLSEPFQVAWIMEKLPLKLQMALNTLSITNEIDLPGIVRVVERAHLKDLDLSVNATRKAHNGRKKKKSWCDFHKKCAHTTQECRLLARKRKSCAANVDDEEIKSDLFYSVSNNTTRPGAANNYTIEVEVEGRKGIRALLDTGAQISCIDSRLARKLSLSVQRGRKIRAFDGSQRDAGYIRKINIRAFRREYHAEMMVIDGLIYPLIIGGDLLLELLRVEGADNLLNQSCTSYANTRQRTVATISDITAEFEKLFSNNIDSEAACKADPHRIDTGNARPIARNRFKMGTPQEELVETEVRKLLKDKVIRPSNSPWSSATVMVKKKDGSPRMCIDYRPLNEVTVRDAYPMPRIDEILDSLVNARVFSTLDATSGYHQIAVAPEDIPKTAFQTRSGLYEFTRMPFGLCNAPATFQRAMDNVLAEEKGKFVQIYLDDIIVYSRSMEEHTEHLRKVFEKIAKAGLRLNKDKCAFYKKELVVLGFRVRENEIYPVESRVQDIKSFPVPRNIKELRSFLGITSYCRSFIKDLAKTALPLTDLLKGSPAEKTTIDLSTEALRAFEEIKNAISKESKLKIPDYGKPFILTTDASTFAIGAILSQKNERGEESPVAFFSQKLTTSQANYSTTQRELLAVVEGIRHFKAYLMHAKFTLRTDHQALTALKHTRNQNSMLLRWSLFLGDFTFDVEYIRGKENPADALSRISSCSKATTEKEMSEAAKEELVREYHLELGHGSAENIIYHLRKKYNWNGLYTDAQNWSKSCKTCLRAGPSTHNTSYTPITTRKPAEILEIDLVGPLDRTARGNRYIVTLVDHFTKYALTEAIPDKTAANIFRFIMKKVLPVFPRPKAFLSDNGLEFSSTVQHIVVENSQARWMRGSPYHPQTQGAVERFNGTLLTKIKKLSNFGKTDWDNVLEPATKAYNVSFHRAIGCSPYEFLHGKIPLFSIDPKHLPESFTREIPRETLERTRMKILKRYHEEFKGKVAMKNEFSVGDRVLRHIPTQRPSKLEPTWEPGYTVDRRLGDEAYLISKGNTNFRVNKTHIKLDLSEF